MKINRRRFVTVLAAGSAGGLIVPAYLRSSSSNPPPDLPFVTAIGSWSVYYPVGQPVLPAGLPASFTMTAAQVDALPIGVTDSSFTPVGEVIPANYQQAFYNYAQANMPPWFTPGPVPQVNLLGIGVGLVLLAGGAYFLYWLYKQAQKIPPPDTNIYR